MRNSANAPRAPPKTASDNARPININTVTGGFAGIRPFIFAELRKKLSTMPEGSGRFGVQRLAAAFLEAPIRLPKCGCKLFAARQAGRNQSGSKPPHSKGPPFLSFCTVLPTAPHMCFRRSSGKCQPITRARATGRYPCLRRWSSGDWKTIRHFPARGRGCAGYLRRNPRRRGGRRRAHQGGCRRKAGGLRAVFRRTR